MNKEEWKKYDLWKKELDKKREKDYGLKKTTFGKVKYL